MPVSISAGSSSGEPRVDALSRLIQDPLFILDLHGKVVECNRQARALLGPAPPGPSAFEIDDGLRALMEAASGSSEPVMGAVTLRTDANGSHRFRACALVIERSIDSFRIAVQVLDTRDDQFSLLSRRVKDLNREIGERQAVQARLEASLEHNAVLYRELQHRVKNHLQMMLGLFAAARRESSSPEQIEFLRRMEAKLHVVFEAQRLMYAHDSTGVPAEQLLSSMAAVLIALGGDRIQIDVAADPVVVSNDVAFPLALIVNELLSNAVKYGVPGGAGRIAASLGKAGADLVLEVRDWGPGFREGESKRRSSGLGLVRGLCRQIGGRVDIASEGGTLVRISFPADA